MKSKKGFTLVELLAVIAILAILVIIAMPNVLKLFRQSRVNANLIVAENYVNAGEQYYTKQFGLSSDFNGKNNISSKLDMSGKRADEEKVYITKHGEVAVYLKIDDECYYKTFGAEKAQHTENAGFCDASLFMAGVPVLPIDDGDGLYFEPDDNKLIYKSDEGLVSGDLINTYCDFSLNDRNGTEDCDENYFEETHFKYSDLIHNNDNVDNWIYFNCEDESNVSSCEKWRIVNYQYTENDGITGELTLISPDMRGIHFDSEDLHVANDDLINYFQKFYYDEYVTDSAKSLITKSIFYNGNISRGEEYEILFPNDVIQFSNRIDLSNVYSSSFEREWGYLDPVQWMEASTNDSCLDGYEHQFDYSGYNLEDIPYSECNNWLNDGSFFLLNDNWTINRNNFYGYFIGELGTIDSDFPGDNGVRPVVKLKSDSLIVSGDGSYSNPYMLKYSNVEHMLSVKDSFVENVKKLIAEAKKSDLNTIYSEKDKYKLNGFDNLEYVIQKNNGNIDSVIVKDKDSQLFKISIGSDFDNISVDDVTTYNNTYDFTYDRLLGLDSVNAWYNNCHGKNTLNCKMVQSNASQLKNNDYSDENNDGLGHKMFYYSYGRETYGNLIFAGYCWRIVRTDEEGNVRLYYNGTPTSGACPSYFNSSIGSSGLSGYNYVNSTGESSPAKTIIDNWYVNNILSKGNNVTSKIANSIYCNDRTNSGYNHNFSCLREDQFTLKIDKGGKNGYGNNLLDYPIALPNAEELHLTNMSYTSAYYPNDYLGGRVEFITMTRTGNTYYQVKELFHNNTPYNKVGTVYYISVIPAISIKENTIVNSGNGSTSNPFVIN